MAMLPPIITVLYTCDSCGLFDIGVNVRARSTEDVMEWMDKTLNPAVGGDHFKRSPHCRVTQLTNVKIPITGASKVGGPSEN